MKKAPGPGRGGDGDGDDTSVDHEAAAEAAKDVSLFDADYVFHRITDTVFASIPEASDLTSETGRQGTKLTSVLRSLYMSEEVGTAAGEIDRRTFLAPHTARFGAVIGAQPEPSTLGVVIAEGPLGTPQRFGFYLVSITNPNGEPPVKRLEIPPVDWTGKGHVAGHIHSLADARAATTPDPVWIHWPPAAAAAIRDNRITRQEDAWKAFSITEVRNTRNLGIAEDMIREARGHELLHQLKLAVTLAIGDGLREPADIHWHAAGVVMEHRALVFRMICRIIAAKNAAKNAVAGASQGQQRAAAKRAEAAAEQLHNATTASRVIEVLTEAGKPASAAKIGRLMGKAQDDELGKLLPAMCAQGALCVAATNRARNPLYWFPGMPH